MLGISRRTLCNYVSQGKIKSSKIGKRCFYKVQEVKEMMNDSDASSKSLL
jgi:predicted site-specific integrase-resolvase